MNHHVRETLRVVAVDGDSEAEALLDDVEHATSIVVPENRGEEALRVRRIELVEHVPHVIDEAQDMRAPNARCALQNGVVAHHVGRRGLHLGRDRLRTLADHVIERARPRIAPGLVVRSPAIFDTARLAGIELALNGALSRCTKRETPEREHELVDHAAWVVHRVRGVRRDELQVPCLPQPLELATNALEAVSEREQVRAEDDVEVRVVAESHTIAQTMTYFLVVVVFADEVE